MCADFSGRSEQQCASLNHFYCVVLIIAERLEQLCSRLGLNNCHELATAVCSLFCPGLFIHRYSH